MILGCGPPLTPSRRLLGRDFLLLFRTDPAALEKSQKRARGVAESFQNNINTQVGPDTEEYRLRAKLSGHSNVNIKRCHAARGC